jgi:hypothetical protein
MAYGLAIDSDLSLPQLEATRGQSWPFLLGKLRIRVRRQEAREPQEWLLQTSLPDGQPWMWAARQERGFLIRYFGLADFIVNSRGTEIVLTRAEPVSSSDTVGHLLLDHALPMVLGLRGIPTLHASSVVTPRGVCAFVGTTGAGKSTLAASFSAAGYPALGDDCLAIAEDGGFFAIPAYPGVRLWMDSARSLSTEWSNAPTVAHYTNKLRIFDASALKNFPTRLEPLAVIYCLARDTAGVDPGAASPSIEPMQPKDAFLELLSASFMLDITDSSVLTRNLRFIERLFKVVAVRRLKIPEGFSSLPKVRETVFNDLGVPAPRATFGAPLGAR